MALPEAPVVLVAITSTAQEPCAGPSVGSMKTKKAFALAEADDPTWYSPPWASPIFADHDMELVANRECCITVRVGLYEPKAKEPSRWATVALPLYCAAP